MISYKFEKIKTLYESGYIFTKIALNYKDEIKNYSLSFHKYKNIIHLIKEQIEKMFFVPMRLLRLW